MFALMPGRRPPPVDWRNWPRIPALRIAHNVRGVYLGAEQCLIFAQALRTIANAVRDPPARP
jgi:hypothetical protein